MRGFFSAPALRPSIGAEMVPYKTLELRQDDATIVLYASSVTGFPVWAYAGRPGSEIWLYLAQPDIPIFSASSTPPRWTSVSRYVAQSADAADATTIESADVSKGGILRSGNALYASDAFGVSEVELSLSSGFMSDGVWPVVKIKAAKGLARTTFTPLDIQNSLTTKFGLKAGDTILFVDRNGALWTKYFVLPEGIQIYPWRANSARYSPEPLVQRFTEQGLNEAINEYAFTHEPAPPTVVPTIPPVTETPPIPPPLPPVPVIAPPPAKAAPKPRSFSPLLTAVGVGGGLWWWLRRRHNGR